MTNTKNILIIGKSGQGKSALANVITGTNSFAESGVATSKTKNYQISQGNSYQVIDTIDLDNDEKLNNTWAAIESVEKKIHQVLFVFGSKFTKEQAATFNKFKEFSNIDKNYITLVRTKFPSFKDRKACEEDRNKDLGGKNDSWNDILYVDNAPIPEIDEEKAESDDEEEINQTKEKRAESQKIILDYLAKNCQQDYQLQIQIPPK